MNRVRGFFRGAPRPWARLPRLLGPAQTVRGRLMRIVLATTAMAVVFAGIAMLTVDLNRYQQSWAPDLLAEAAILAVSATPALAFDDREAAVRNVTALGARRRVVAAALYTADGRLYASFLRAGSDPPPASPPLPGLRTYGERVELVQRIERNGEVLGTLYLRARYDVLARVEDYLGVLALVTVLSLMVAFLLSRPLQGEITEPLDAIAKIAREIVTHRDYSLRAQKSADDEIGIVVDAFNSMLTEVEARSRALEQSNRALTGEIAARESTQVALRLATARLESTMAAAEIGSWQWDLRSNDFTADRNLAALYGVDDEHALNGSPHLQHRYIHPDDLGAVRRAEDNALSAGVFEPTEFRVQLRNGSERWVARRGRVQLGEDGRAAFISGLIIDVTAQKRAEQALREADRRKDEFLATLAHELRNPLAPIRHAVKLLESSDADELRQQWARDVISRQVHRMALLLDDLLDVSRITQGRLALKVETVSLKSIVDTAVETARPLLESKRHELSIELPAGSVQLTVDPLRLSQSLSNLLTNSAKYTDAGGRIALTVAVLPTEIVLSVKDSGIGFESTTLPKLFEMFSQVDSAIARSEGGLGIGLALVKGLIGLHEGHIDAHSEGLGRGSEFRIHLPRSVAVVGPALEQIIAEAASVNARLRVLVVDDNRDAADSLAMLLELNGHDMSIAHDGEQALRLAEQVRPQAIILDIGMPDMSGYDVARCIRAAGWGVDVYLVAVTGWGQKEDKARALAAGFDHHLTKPVDPDQIEAVLQLFAQRGRPPAT